MRWSVLPLLSLALAAAGAEDLGEFKEVYMWNKLSFEFPDESTRLRVLSDAKLDNCALHALRTWRGRFFVSVPRWRGGVPVTLASLPAVTQHNVSGPNLTPFPSWDMQAQGNCSALQSVLGIEVDRQGRLWVADSGSGSALDGGANSRVNPCMPKVVQIDAETGRVVRIYQLEGFVTAPDSVLADVVVGDDDLLYISDASATDPGIIVLNTRDGRSWKVTDAASMRGENMFVQVEQRRTELRYNVFGLALSPRDPQGRTERRLYYAPLNSKHLYSVPLSALTQFAPGGGDMGFGPGADHGERKSNRLTVPAKDHGERVSPTQAMTVDAMGRLYSGPLTESAVDRWDTSKDLATSKLISQDHVRLQWPSSFTIDDQGYLWIVSNRMQVYMAGTPNQYDSNYRVIRAFIDAKSYMNDLVMTSSSSSSAAPAGATGLPSPTTPSATPTTHTHSTPHSTKPSAAPSSSILSAPLFLVAAFARLVLA